MKSLTYVANSNIEGLGLFATVYIPRGSIIGWLQGRPCDEDGSYVLWINDAEAILVECDLKYINHSDRPNACYYDDLSVVALRDILPREEITHDYSGSGPQDYSR